jgi:tetratricopeptide (TPR) repeat protein
MEQWEELDHAYVTSRRIDREWFNPERRARIELGLGRSHAALAILEKARHGKDETRGLVAEANLQLNNEKAVEAALRRPPRAKRRPFWVSRGDFDALYAWGLLYRQRGDRLRALYCFEQPSGGPVMQRSQFLAAAETLVELDLPGEAAVVLEQMLELTVWVKPEDFAMLVECYRDSGRVAKAERVERALTAKMAKAHPSTGLWD